MLPSKHNIRCWSSSYNFFLILILFISCQPNSQEEKYVVEAILEVDPSKLNSELLYSSDLTIQYQIPSGFEKVNWLENVENLSNPSVYFDKVDSSIIIYSEATADKLFLSDSVKQQYIHVSETEFISNNLNVHQMILQKADVVNFQLLFRSPRSLNSYRMDYFIKPEALGLKMKSIESSIGSFSFLTK